MPSSTITVINDMETDILKYIYDNFDAYITLALTKKPSTSWFSKKKIYECPIGLPNYLLSLLINNKDLRHRVSNNIANYKNDESTKYAIKLFNGWPCSMVYLTITTTN